MSIYYPVPSFSNLFLKNHFRLFVITFGKVLGRVLFQQTPESVTFAVEEICVIGHVLIKNLLVINEIGD